MGAYLSLYVYARARSLQMPMFIASTDSMGALIVWDGLTGKIRKCESGQRREGESVVVCFITHSRIEMVVAEVTVTSKLTQAHLRVCWSACAFPGGIAQFDVRSKKFFNR